MFVFLLLHTVHTILMCRAKVGRVLSVHYYSGVLSVHCYSGCKCNRCARNQVAHVHSMILKMLRTSVQNCTLMVGITLYLYAAWKIFHCVFSYLTRLWLLPWPCIPVAGLYKDSSVAHMTSSDCYFRSSTPLRSQACVRWTWREGVSSRRREKVCPHCVISTSLYYG